MSRRSRSTESSCPSRVRASHALPIVIVTVLLAALVMLAAAPPDDRTPCVLPQDVLLHAPNGGGDDPPPPPFPSYIVMWDILYPDSTSDDAVINGTGSNCQLCHEDDNGGNGWNAYGWRMRELYDGGLDLIDAIAGCENLDSDLDPNASNNLAEIDGDAQPGWTAGPNNTIYFKNLTTLENQLPPAAIAGDLDLALGTWTDLGNGLAGTGGLAPSLAGDGTLLGGDTATFSLSDAKPGALAYYVLGISNLGAPFKGGVLVPSPDIQIPVIVDPLGQIVFGFAWPLGIPAGVSLWYQYWIVDPGGPFGFAASNGLQSTTP